MIGIDHSWEIPNGDSIIWFFQLLLQQAHIICKAPTPMFIEPEEDNSALAAHNPDTTIGVTTPAKRKACNDPPIQLKPSPKRPLLPRSRAAAVPMPARLSPPREDLNLDDDEYNDNDSMMTLVASGLGARLKPEARDEIISQGVKAREANINEGKGVAKKVCRTYRHTAK